MFRAVIAAACVWVAMTTGSVLEAQQRFPLAAAPSDGRTVSPFFEGWYANPDGTYTLSFGYFNRNREEVVEIPLGPDNFIEPREYDGPQPTSFPPFDYKGLNGRRERGVFTITVPADFRDGSVTWTLRNRGETHVVSGHIRSPEYQLSHSPMAMGSIPPTVRFAPGADGFRGPAGSFAEVRKARVGEPIDLEIRTVDESRRTMGENPLNVTWFKHSGPIGDNVSFTPQRLELAEGESEAHTSVTFSEAGDYVIRVRADNFGAIDSAPGDQCCWTNAYFPVRVSE